MKPANFPEANRNLTKPQGMTDKECGTLPVYSNGTVCVSLWKPTLRERLSLLLFGNLWLFVHSGHTQPPVALDIKKQMFVTQDKGGNDG